MDAAIAAAKDQLEAANADGKQSRRWSRTYLSCAASCAPSGAVLDETGAEIEADADPTEPETEPFDRDAALSTLREKTAQLTEAQGETPLILPSVDRQAVAAVVQDWTGIPMGRMLSSQSERALALAETLAERVVGQDHAMEMIANRIQTATAGLGAPEKPVGVSCCAALRAWARQKPRWHWLI